MAITTTIILEADTSNIVRNVASAFECVFALTPSDSAQYSNPVEVYVGVTGDVTIGTLTQPLVPITFKNVPAGSRVPVKVSVLYATNTTAQSLLGLH
jgi:hypothetical protein